MFDGLLFNPQQPQPATPEQQAQLKQSWDQYLSDPKVRAGMLSMGLQLMTGGWGGFGQQLAQGIGAGAEAYGGVEKLQQDEARRQEAQGLALGEKEKDRNLRVQLEQMQQEGADKRLDKTLSAREDARSGGGAYSKGAQQLYRTTYAQALKRAKEGDLINGIDPLDDDAAQTVAAEAAAKAADAFDGRFGGPSNSAISAAMPGKGGSQGPGGKAATGPLKNAISPPTATSAPPNDDSRIRALQAILGNPEQLALTGRTAAQIEALIQQERERLYKLNPPLGNLGVP